MALWQIALLALGLAWIAQSAGVYLQVQHYQKTFAAIRARWSDGRLGTGAAPSRIGKGVLVILVVNNAGVVRQLSAMRGRSVFAKFEERREFEGLSLEELRARAEDGRIDGGLAPAVAKAIAQIERLDQPVAARGKAVDRLATT
jgi:glucitol operon activator protein